MSLHCVSTTEDKSDITRYIPTKQVNTLNLSTFPKHWLAYLWECYGSQAKIPFRFLIYFFYYSKILFESKNKKIKK